MGISKNMGTPKSSNLIRFSIINHPFWGTPILGNIHMNDHVYTVNYYVSFKADFNPVFFQANYLYLYQE